MGVCIEGPSRVGTRLGNSTPGPCSETALILENLERSSNKWGNPDGQFLPIVRGRKRPEADFRLRPW